MQFKPITYNWGSHSKLEVTADCYQLSKWGCPIWHGTTASSCRDTLRDGKSPKKTPKNKKQLIFLGHLRTILIGLSQYWSFVILKERFTTSAKQNSITLFTATLRAISLFDVSSSWSWLTSFLVESQQHNCRQQQQQRYTPLSNEITSYKKTQNIKLITIKVIN